MFNIITTNAVKVLNYKLCGYLWQRLDALSSHLDDGLRGARGGGADVFHDET